VHRREPSATRNYQFSEAAAEGKLLAPAKSIEEMQRVAFNNYLDAVVCAFFALLVVAMCVFAAKTCLQALKQSKPTTHEIPPLPPVVAALA
jgi:carbon starvation protein